jgi:hypothetical protein
MQVTANPAMNYDTRNQGLVGMSDGIPMFRDKCSRSVIPCMMRTGNMGDDKSMKFRFSHMTALIPCYFWTIGKSSQHFDRVERKPSDLRATMHAIVDDILRWEEGELTEDHSKSPADPDRWFRLRVRLLYWCGDYPGQGEASGFSHSAKHFKACHWCEDRGVYCGAINRQKFCNYYRCVYVHIS